MGITIKQLSQISGYSSSTICRVINNSGGVKKETQKKIEELLYKYQYRTNIMDLRRLSVNNKKVMIIVGNIKNGYYMEQAHYLNCILKTHNYNTIIMTSDCNPDDEEEYVKMAIKESYAGVIFTDISMGEFRENIPQNTISLICMNRNVPFSSFDSVISDNYQGGFMATQYLITKGHKKIVYLAGNKMSYSAHERLRGFREAMFKNILPITENTVYTGNLDIESGYNFGEMIIKKCIDCTAVFVGNDQMAIGFLEAMHAYGVSIPDDISLICYDHSSLAMSLGIASVGVEPKKISEKSVEILLDRLNGSADEVQDVLIKPYIAERHTIKNLNLGKKF